MAILPAAFVTVLRLGSVRLRELERLRDDFFAELFRAGDFRALFFRAGPRELDFRADFIPREADFREDDLRAGPFRPLDLRPAPPFLPVFEPPRDDFLATAILPSSNVGVLLRHYSNFRAQKTTAVYPAGRAAPRFSRRWELDRIPTSADPTGRERTKDIALCASVPADGKRLRTSGGRFSAS